MELFAMAAVLLVVICVVCGVTWGIYHLCVETKENGWGAVTSLLIVLFSAWLIWATQGIILAVAGLGWLTWIFISGIRKDYKMRKVDKATAEKEKQESENKAYKEAQYGRRIQKLKLGFNTVETLFDLAVFGYWQGRIPIDEIYKINNLLLEVKGEHLVGMSDKPQDVYYKTFAETDYGMTQTQKII